MTAQTTTTNSNIQAMIAALKNAGFTGANLVTMTAIGLSESGGNPQAFNNNPSTGDYSIGWFQINYYGGLYQSRAAQFGTPQQLIGNPQGQANAAYVLSGGGQTFSPWQSDFNNGSYYKNLPTAQAAVNAFQGGATTIGAVGSAPTTNATLTSATTKCLIPSPFASLGAAGTILGGTGIDQILGGSSNPNCLMTQDQGKHILGGLCIVGGILAGLVGLVMLAKKEVNPLAAVGSLPTPVGAAAKVANNTQKPKNSKPKDEISESEFRRRAGGRSDSELANVGARNAASKKASDKRRTFDAKSGRNAQGEKPEDIEPF